MKRIGVLICILFILGTTNAQTWCAPGAEWHLRSLMPFPLFYQDGYIKINPVAYGSYGTSTVYRLDGVFNGKLYTTPATYTQVTLYSLYTFESNQVIYARLNGSVTIFDTIANFNAVPGDSWRALYYSYPLADPTCTVERVTVTDTGHVMINGFSLKKLKVTMPYYSTFRTYEIVERIGCLAGFLFPLKRCDIDGFDWGSLACFKDNTFPLYQPPGYTLPCDFTTVGLGENNFVDSDFKVYPNPGSNKVIISFPELWNGKNTNLVVRDALGKKVKEQKLTGTCEFDFGEYPAGFYQIELSIGNQILACKKWIKSEQ
ncbi:MAG TPA: T9SS type A sorting domain-containing protein [Bacteroidia bacterium]|nr:T9SS type A sorting domain-containing protein [Bacteroidia bacterium]